MSTKLRCFFITFLCFFLLTVVQGMEGTQNENDVLAVVNQHSQQIARLGEENEKLTKQLNLLVDNYTNLVNFAKELVPVPIGTIVEYSGTAALSEHWLECDGRVVNRVDYPKLLDVIGVTYGVGDSLKTFNLPDRRGRVAVGIGSDNKTGDRITTVTAEKIALGQTFGEETHKLTIDEMPNHDHKFAGTGKSNGGRTDLVKSEHGPECWDVSTGYVGDNQPRNNMQPSIFVKFFIRAK